MLRNVIIDKLRQFNEWRRGSDEKEMLDPKEIGECIDRAIEELKKPPVSATLQFDLSDPDARRDHHKAVNANDYYFCLIDINDLWRKYLKYGHAEHMTKHEALQAVFKDIQEVFENNKINID